MATLSWKLLRERTNHWQVKQAIAWVETLRPAEQEALARVALRRSMDIRHVACAGFWKATLEGYV